MNPRWAVVFATVAEEGSFTRAASRLNIAQPWLSAQMRKLEAQVGFPLFDRRKGGIKLSRDGERLLPLAADIARSAQQLRELSREIYLERSLFIRMGINATSSSIPELARINDDFSDSYRDVSILIESSATEQLLEALAGGQLDIALVVEPFDAAELKTLLLRQTSPYVLTLKDSPLAGLLAVTGNDLVGTTLGSVWREDHRALYDLLLKPLVVAGAQLRTVPEANRGAMEHFVRSQKTSVLMLEGDVADYAADEQLVAIPFVTDVRIRHTLVMSAGLQNRGVDRYWRAAEALAGQA